MKNFNQRDNISKTFHLKVWSVLMAGSIGEHIPHRELAFLRNTSTIVRVRDAMNPMHIWYLNF